MAVDADVVRSVYCLSCRVTAMLAVRTVLERTQAERELTVKQL